MMENDDAFYYALGRMHERYEECLPYVDPMEFSTVFHSYLNEGVSLKEIYNDMLEDEMHALNKDGK
jgi:hypothetical protein